MKSHKSLPSRAPLLLSAVGLFLLVITTQAQPTPPHPPTPPHIIGINTIINITNQPWGAVSSTTLTNTTAIQNAINAASTTNGGAGATVEIPGGTYPYLCGPINMANNVNLQIDTNATLKMLPYANWPGTTTFINCGGISNFEITGFGTIDGSATTADWWNGLATSSRPYLIYVTGSQQMLFQDITVINPPKMHFAFKSGGGNITFLRVHINTSGTSPNTDGIDLTGTNCLVQDCTINAGDDNIALGTSSSGVPSADILVTNCNFGTGHGLSIGSNTQGGVSNLTVINCSFVGTDNGIRMKSDNATSGGGGEGGIAQNLYYCSNRMVNIKYAPIIIWSYYNNGSYGNPTIAGITPAKAAATNAATITSYTPVWRNIVISNLWASAGQPGMIWARTEMPATNITLRNLDITATGSYQNFEIYNAKQIQIVDSQFHLSASANTNFWLFNADVTFTNSSASTSPISLYGVTTNSYANSLAFYNSRATLSATNTLGAGPLTLGDSILTISNNFTMFPTTVLNYTLDLNTNRVAVVGNLALGGTINATNSPGFVAGTNTLLTYTGTLSGSLPTLGSTPSGPYTNFLDTSIAGQVNLVTKPTNPSTSTTTSVQSSANPSTYGNTVTVYRDGQSRSDQRGKRHLHGRFNHLGCRHPQQRPGNVHHHRHPACCRVPFHHGGLCRRWRFWRSTSSALTQTVNARTLTVSGLTVNSKVYDGTTAATLNTNGYVLNTVVSGDVVTLVTNGYTATFANANVANGISVTVTNLSLGGAQASNYTLTQPAGLTGNITPAGSSILPGASANPVAHLSPVTFTANMTPSTLSGTVLFLTNGVVFNSQTLSGGAATSTSTAVLPRGTNTITAQYSGNANYSPSTNTLNEVVTNNPPTANTALYYRLVGYPLTIVITNLATNWNDLDGDTMTLAGVSSPSTNGATVTYDSTKIYYSDSNNVTDRFGYTISDGQGGTNNGVVSVLLAQQTVSDVTVSNGSVTLDFMGIPGSTYWVMAATNLTPPELDAAQHERRRHQWPVAVYGHTSNELSPAVLSKPIESIEVRKTMLSRSYLAPRIFFLLALGGCWGFTTTMPAAPALPNINTNNIVNITSFGAVSSTTLTNTTAIQNAINAATAGGTTNGLSGGTAEIPAGTYLSGPLTLANNVNLQLDSGAILRMLPFGQYPVTWFTNGGTNIYFTANNFISGTSLTNIEISGSGAIDGQGLPWWPWANTNQCHPAGHDLPVRL